MTVNNPADFDWPRIFNKALVRGGWLAEAFFERSRTLSLDMENHNLEKATAGQDQGLGLRILFGDQTAYGYTNEVTEAAATALAGELSLAVSSDYGLAAKDLVREKPIQRYRVVKPTAGLELAAKAELVKRADRAAWAVDKRIRQVKVVYGERDQEVFIANSQGLAVTDARSNLVFFIQCVAADGSVIQTGYQPIGGTMGLELFDDHSPEWAAEEAARRAVLMLEAKPAPGGRMPVVLAAEAGGTMIHEAVGHGLEADLALENLSVYADKLGQPIAAKGVTVYDDGTWPAMRGSFGYDDEGVPARKTALIKDGVLTAYMSNRLYAHKGDLPLTGNGRRESFRHRPIVRMSNTYIAPGTEDPQSILSATDKGLYVVKMGGGQVNTANGDFVFEVSEGYVIENGRQGRPVRGATLVGSGPEALMGMDLIGSDLGWGIGTCGKDGQGAPVGDAQPTLRIAELLVGSAV